MPRIATTALILTATCALAACDASDDFDPDTEFRSSPGDGDIGVHAGTAVTDPDCLIWDYAGDGIVNGPASPGLTGTLVWHVANDGKDLVDPNGQLACSMHWVDASTLQLRQGSNGPVLATQEGWNTFGGDITNIPEVERWQYIDHAFHDASVTDGPWYGDKLVTATEELAYGASATRKLSIAALVMGLCGSPGLPETPPGN